jgi:hypothetical protein
VVGVQKVAGVPKVVGVQKVVDVLVHGHAENNLVEKKKYLDADVCLERKY